MDPQKVKAILECPAPVNKKGVQRFVGFANFYRGFIKKFAAIISPITQVTRQHIQFKWSFETQAAFDKLKTLFISAPVLQHHKPTLPYALEVDASEIATGAILSQNQGSTALLYPIAFSSCKMSQPESNYDVGDQELLVLKTAFEEWRCLLEGEAHPIMIFTDNKHLVNLRTAKHLKPHRLDGH